MKMGWWHLRAAFILAICPNFVRAFIGIVNPVGIAKDHPLNSKDHALTRRSRRDRLKCIGLRMTLERSKESEREKQQIRVRDYSSSTTSKVPGTKWSDAAETADYVRSCLAFGIVDQHDM